MEVGGCWEKCTVQGCASSHVQPERCGHSDHVHHKRRHATINLLWLGFPLSFPSGSTFDTVSHCAAEYSLFTLLGKKYRSARGEASEAYEDWGSANRHSTSGPGSDLFLNRSHFLYR
jgi:hypothetical protein